MSFTVAAIVGAGVGVAKLIGASSRKKKAKEAQKKAKAEMDAKKKQYEALDTSNLKKGMENVYEDLTVDQRASDFAQQKGEQSRANVMEKMRGAAGSSGIAALAQTMANQGQLAAQQASADIGKQESENQQKALAETARLQDEEISGAKESRDLERQKTTNLLAAASGEVAAAGAAKDQASKDQMNAVGSIATSVIGSDRRLKKNINKIGESSSGLNIYSFEYKNPTHGKGLFQGVMSDEIPQEAIVLMNGYDAVDYSMLDVEFKRI